MTYILSFMHMHIHLHAQLNILFTNIQLHHNMTSEETTQAGDFASTYRDLTAAEKQADDLERKLADLDKKMDAILESDDMKELQDFINTHGRDLDTLSKQAEAASESVAGTEEVKEVEKVEKVEKE